MAYDIHKGQTWSRKTDGAIAIVSHCGASFVYYRRSEDGELLRVGLKHFRAYYEPITVEA